MVNPLIVFLNYRMLVVLLLGFASGLPLALTGGTLQAWLTSAKIDLPTIGRFALVGLPYTVKFLWAPILDEYAPPLLGRRRGWGLITQIGLIGSVLMIAMLDPSRNLLLFALGALAVAFFSASQDVVLDAFRTEILEEHEYGAGAGVYVMGYRLAMLVSGALALYLADPIAGRGLSWMKVYFIMAAFMMVGPLAVIFGPEPKVVHKISKSFRDRVLLPFAEFFKRPSAVEILSFVMVYKLSTMMATALTTRFLMGLEFTMTEIGAVSKVYGLIATIVGTMAGGALMTQLGLKRSLWIFGILQALGGLSFLILAESGKNPLMLIVVLSVENFMIGMGVAAISGFMMNVCSKQFTGTQFALLSSLTAVSRVVLVSEAGTLVEKLGWAGFFIFSVTLAIPGLLLLTRFDDWMNADPALVRDKISKVDLVTIAFFILGLLLISCEPLFGLQEALRPLAPWIAKSGAGCVGIALLIGFLKPRRKARRV